MRTRAEFFYDTRHKIVFYCTPKHCFWLNQIETWVSILVHKLSKRASLITYIPQVDK